MIYNATNLFVVRVVERAVQLGQVCAGTVSRRGRHWSDSQEGDVVIGRQEESVRWGRLWTKLVFKMSISVDWYFSDTVVLRASEVWKYLNLMEIERQYVGDWWAGGSKHPASIAPHTIVIETNGFGLCLYFKTLFNIFSSRAKCQLHSGMPTFGKQLPNMFLYVARSTHVHRSYLPEPWPDDGTHLQTHCEGSVFGQTTR